MQLRSILVALALGATSAFMRPASVSRVTARFSVEDKLKEIVAEQLGVEQSSITGEASFAGDLGADSLDVVEMARCGAGNDVGCGSVVLQNTKWAAPPRRASRGHSLRVTLRPL